MLPLFIAVSLIFSGPLSASDQSDAQQLRERCEAEYKALDVAVKNFGSDKVRSNYQSAADLLKSAKVKFAQSKYQEAITLYNQYLKAQQEIYKSLAADYITRTETIYNDTAAELVDFLDNDKVSQYFKLANQNIADAKKAMLIENYKLAIETSRLSKKYSIDSYKAAGKPVPEKYRKDVKDINKEIDQSDLKK